MTLLKNESSIFSIVPTNFEQNLAIKIVGATANEDMKSLLKIFQENEGDLKVAHVTLSGIFYLTCKSTESLNTTLFIDYGGDTAKKLLRFLEVFEKTLQGDLYREYPLPIAHDKTLTKEVYWSEIMEKLFEKIYYFSLSQESSYSKERVLKAFECVNRILWIVYKENIHSVREPFDKNLDTLLCKAIDSYYERTFSNSVNKIWDAGRSKWEYFLKRTILFNPNVPEETKKVIWKRWQAWFLLEDQYKMTEKKVVRKNLIKELEEGLNLLK